MQDLVRPSPLRDQRILITGASGFVGRWLVKELVDNGCTHVLTPSHHQFDLTDRPATIRLIASYRPDVVIHLAGVVGGIGANMREPGRFFYENLRMGTDLIEESRLHGVKKFVQVGTICAYPKHTPVPFREEDLWSGYPEETNAPYGIAKKALLVQLQAYRQQYGFNGIYLLPVNMYGPGDNFDPETSHVIPALIRKFVEAKRSGAPEVVLWGTGTASREFLYVKDAARAIRLAAERYDGGEPVNIGVGSEITIAALAARIRDVVGYTGRIVYDPTRPDGQPRRCLDTRRAKESFGFEATTPFEEGLRETLQWYLTHG